MAKIVKVIEVLSESPKSWEESAQNVVSEASKTLRITVITEITVSLRRARR